MFNNLDASHVVSINAAVHDLCKNPEEYGELAQLRWLFRKGFRRKLQKLLNQSLVNASEDAVYEVGIGWIDKIPLAKSLVLSNKTELGDAMLFSFEDTRNYQGRLLNRRSRAAILQAKVADNGTQMSNPIVPVGTSSSTPRELTLLSEWPLFDLYQTSGHKVSCLTNVSVLTAKPTGNPPPHGWFIVAPGRKPEVHEASSWPCWWMAGPAAVHAPCSTTLGEIIVGFLQPGSTAADVGAEFIRVTPHTPQKNGSSADWDDLCNEVLRILNEYNAPKKLFGEDHDRLVTIRGQQEPEIFRYRFRQPIIDPCLRRFGLIGWTGYPWGGGPEYRSSYPPKTPEEAETVGEGDGGMLVLNVTLTRFEGEGEVPLERG
jgi:hypothetical protein